MAEMGRFAGISGKTESYMGYSGYAYGEASDTAPNHIHVGGLMGRAAGTRVPGNEESETKALGYSQHFSPALSEDVALQEQHEIKALLEKRGVHVLSTYANNSEYKGKNSTTITFKTPVEDKEKLEGAIKEVDNHYSKGEPLSGTDPTQIPTPPRNETGKLNRDEAGKLKLNNLRGGQGRGFNGFLTGPQ